MSDQNTLSSFEHLPAEIIAEIFKFLTFRELGKSFSDLNSYINSVINLMTDINHAVTQGETDAINLLHSFPSTIVCLSVVHAKTVDLTSLINLRSLTLKYGTHDQFNSIRPKNFPNLEILDIYASELLKSLSIRMPLLNFVFKCSVVCFL